MAISDQLTALSTIKGDIKAAIIAKGGTATDDMTTYATAISNLPSGGGGEDLKNLIERDITSIDIPNGTTSIGDFAFQDCYDLTTITIPDSVTRIGQSAFYDCTSLTNTDIPGSVTSMGSYAFYRCSSLTSVVLPELTNIGASSFQYCTGLRIVRIPSTVTTIGDSAFAGCTSLHTIICLAATPPTIQSNSLQNIIAGCPIYVPSASVEAYKAANVWSDMAAFIRAIDEVTLSATFTTTEADERVTIASKPAAFVGINVDGSAITPSIHHTFATVGEHQVEYMSPTDNFYEPDYLKGCDKMTSLTIPDEMLLTSINFDGCDSLSELVIDNSAAMSTDERTSGGIQTNFYNLSGDISVIVGDSVTTVGKHKFRSWRDLVSVVFSDSVTTFNTHTFYGCTGLTSVTLGRGVTSFGGNNFNNCTAMTSLTCRAATPPTIASTTLTGLPADCNIYVPAASVADYQAAQYWSDRAAYIQAIQE